MKGLIHFILLAMLLCMTISISKKETLQAVQEQLQAKLNKYQEDLSKLQQQVKSIRSQLESSKGKSALTLSKLQQGLANERDILNSIEGYLSLPFNVSTCQCYDLTPEEKQRVLKQINSIKSKLTTLQQNQNLSEDCPRFEEIKLEILRQKRYILGVEQALTSNLCGQRQKKTILSQSTSGLVDIAQSEYQTNLKSKNWCYGKLTKDQVKLLWFAFTVKNNIANCPIETPFFDGKRCINCEAPTAFFDLSLKRCINAQSVDQDRRCIGGDSSFGSSTGNAVFKDVVVSPLTTQPIVKKITFNNQKKSIDKVVDPIYGKALIHKIKTRTNINYIQVQPNQSDPLVKRSNQQKSANNSSEGPSGQKQTNNNNNNHLQLF